MQTVDILVRATTSQAQSALGAVSKILEAVYRDVKRAVDEYSNYANAIGKAAKLTGVTAEEMSRLTQAADDAFVSQEALTRSFQMALKNGFVPTIENVAKLSDELLAMENPAERAEAASKIFGRGWAEIAPFILQGGDAIRKNTDAIADGLIVTDEAVEQNIKYKQATDELNDQFQALSYTAGKTLVPALTQVLIVTTNLLSIYDRETVTVETLEETLLRVPPAYRAIERERLNNILVGKELLDLVGKETEGIAGYNGILERTPGILSNTSGAASAAAGALAGYSAVLGNIATLNDDVATAQQSLADAQKDWQAGAGGQVAGLLEAQGLKGQDLIVALAGVDDVMGTSLSNQETYNQKLAAATAEFAKSRDLDAFKVALGGIKDEFMPMAEKVQAATDKVIALEKRLKELDGMRVNILIDIQQAGGFTLPGSAGAAVPGGGGAPSPVYTPPSGAPSTPIQGGPLSGQSININVNNNVDASKVAADIALAIQRRK